jgi:uncharacterized C2H2 Zn-finger protein
MRHIKVEDEIVCVGDDSFHCPHCGKVYNGEKYTDRINRNKSGYTRVYCECRKLFDVVIDSLGKLHGVLTLKHVRELESEIDNKYYE